MKQQYHYKRTEIEKEEMKLVQNNRGDDEETLEQQQTCKTISQSIWVMEIENVGTKSQSLNDKQEKIEKLFPPNAEFICIVIV